MKILMAWEVGRNLGHVTKIANLAQEMSKVDKKAEIIFALKQPGAILPYLKHNSYRILQAPFYPLKPAPQADRLTFLYCDDLKTCGYLDSPALAGLITSWQGLYDLIQPDILVAQAAPTALLAARSYKFKKVVFGGGYDIPIRTRPLPSLLYWENKGKKELAEREKLIVNHVNDALKLLNQPKIKHFAEAIACDQEYLTSFEELDHYRDRASLTKETSTYYGANYTIDNGVKAGWKPRTKQHIFAYLQFTSNQFKPTIAALMGLPKDFDVIVAVPNIPLTHKSEIEKKAPHIRIFDQAVKLSALLKDCHLGICHGSSGMGAAFAIHGVPQLLLPQHLEQFMFSRALGRHKLARGIMGNVTAKEVSQLIGVLLNEEEYQTAAQQFAQKYAGHTPQKTNQAIAEGMLSLVQKKK